LNISLILKQNPGTLVAFVNHPNIEIDKSNEKYNKFIFLGTQNK